MSDTDAAPKAPQRSKEQLNADIEKTRADLKATLDAIEFKLNLPKQARHAAHRVKSRIATLRDQNPIGFAVGVAAAVAAVGIAAVLGFRSASKK
ncbi:DUF3618 domain-containing protein [Herbiconiux sp. UC225_62]|uniref:DUF3618 domain-containing protein n=1 Tax=Herbiconiux sp. UC225_62 TaxID=3350168 RepID=UPI0036D36145